MKRLFLCCLTFLLAISLVACGTNGGSGDNSVTIMMENDLGTLDASLVTDGTGIGIIRAFTDGIYAMDEEGTLQLALAESEDISEDGLTYTYTLKDAYWSNGDPVTANDFVYAWHRAIDEKSEYAYLFGTSGANIKNAQDVMDNEGDSSTIGITAVDDKTLVIELDAPCAFLKTLLAFPTFFPLNESFVEQQGDDYSTSVSHLLSNGAYVLSEWEVGTKVVLVKNEDYYDADAVQIDSLTINLAQDQSAAALQFDNGELDYCIISSSLVDTYKDTDEYSTISNGFLWYLYVNFENEYLANENIRKGLSSAIDRVDLCDNILKDGSSPATGFVPSDLYTTSEGIDFASACGDLLETNEIDYDLEKAQAYIDAGLAELGVDEISLSLVYGTDESVDTVATYLEQALNALDGVTLTLTATQKQSRISNYQATGEFDLSLTRWGPDYEDPTTYLTLLEKSQWSNYNYGHYYNETYDELLASARVELDEETRDNELIEANTLAVSEVAIIPLFEQGQAVLTSSSLTGLIHTTNGYTYKYLKKS
ncbi:MAG: peptide ABC transporter substrate-binding protein [Erysipelotrichaceae bacterium]|nr:peptide ABC transporter substrate-binding protein [Erysipelotrichaceae bacterium]